MNYTAEKLEKSQVKFNYTVDKDAFNAAIKQAYEKQSINMQFPVSEKVTHPKRLSRVCTVKAYSSATP